MTMKNFELLVYIGRFQPFHFGHLAVITQALAISDRLLILCGSAHQARSVRNPWTIEERTSMVRQSLDAKANKHTMIEALPDFVGDDDLWVSYVKDLVSRVKCDNKNGGASCKALSNTIPSRNANVKIGLIGHTKDTSSYYLEMFPQWERIEVKNREGIDATDIRKNFFSDESKRYLRQKAQLFLPEPVRTMLFDFRKTIDFQNLCEDKAYFAQYAQAWSMAPYPPMLITADALVVQGSHILLVRRKNSPGKGLLALPGGFVNHDESIETACYRELVEETNLDLTYSAFRAFLKRHRVFDDPQRSLRGRTITHAFLISLPSKEALPIVEGGDDACAAHWVELGSIQEPHMFEDHYHIIQTLTNNAKYPSIEHLINHLDKRAIHP